MDINRSVALVLILDIWMEPIPAGYQLLGTIEPFLLIEKINYPGKWCLVDLSQNEVFAESRKPVAGMPEALGSGGSGLFASEHGLLKVRQKGQVNLFSHWS